MLYNINYVSLPEACRLKGCTMSDDFDLSLLRKIYADAKQESKDRAIASGDPEVMREHETYSAQLDESMRNMCASSAPVDVAFDQAVQAMDDATGTYRGGDPARDEALIQKLRKQLEHL